MKTTSTPGCPNDLDERTELYCLKRLTAEETSRFEAHLVGCPACLFEVLNTDMFLESLVQALRENSLTKASRAG